MTADDKPKELAGWGTVVDPDGDCEATLAGGDLTLTVPATPHNLNPRLGRLNGVRVLRSVSGDFTAKLKVSGKFEPGTRKTSPAGAVPFVGAGLLVWADRDLFVRLERCAWVLPDGRRVGYRPLWEAVVGGEVQDLNKPAAPAEAGPVWLRLDRHGDTLTARSSPDGKTWTTAGEVTADWPARLQVGASAVNASDAVFPATFSGFKVVADD